MKKEEFEKAEEIKIEEEKKEKTEAEIKTAEENKDKTEDAETKTAEKNKDKTEDAETKTVEEGEEKTAEKETKTEEENEEAEENVTKTSEGKLEEPNTEETKEADTKSNKKYHKKIFLMCCAALIVIAVVVYLGGAVFYKSHFLPGSSVNGVDVNNMNSAKALQCLESTVSEYSFSVTGRDENGTAQTLGTISAADIDMANAVTADALNDCIDTQNEWVWLTEWIGNSNHSFQVLPSVVYDKDELKAALNTFPSFDKKTIIIPENAYISDYSESTHGYEIISETLGNKPDISAMADTIIQTLSQGLTGEIDVQSCYATAAVTSEDAALNNALDEVNRWTSANIVYDWNGSEVDVDGDLIKDWITFEDTADGKTTPVLDEDAVKEFVKENAKANDTYGKKRTFTTTDGVELTLSSGAYGWKTDTTAETEALINSIKNGENISKEPEYTSRGANKGSEDIGSSYVEIDLSDQHLYLYEDGEIVLETDFVSGNMSNGNFTPAGVFGITYKTRNAVLRGANYETPVNYWMPFNGNVGMHDATWRSSFGGDIYLTSGSHGCINLPLEKAAEIYEYMSAGFPVICYYY
jgi:lipoprotein-anchoring transpeptidase ErfK/SrfK/flagellar biosynthesis GTPase FlhF